MGRCHIAPLAGCGAVPGVGLSPPRPRAQGCTPSVPGGILAGAFGLNSALGSSLSQPRQKTAKNWGKRRAAGGTERAWGWGWGVGDPDTAQPCSWPCQTELPGLSARAVTWARRGPGHGAAAHGGPAELGVPGLPKEGRAAQLGWEGTHGPPHPLPPPHPQPHPCPCPLPHPIINSIPSSSSSHPAPDTGCARLLRAGREGTLGTGAAIVGSCPATPERDSRVISSPPTRRSHRCPSSSSSSRPDIGTGCVCARC